MRVLILFLIIVGNLFAWDGRQDNHEIAKLKGYWKFEIGDNPKWADPDFNDADWEEIFVPSTWEDEGFPGYDGYAWYRKEFTIKQDVEISNCYLYVGVIDDTDETYINGHFIGYYGQFPPEFSTAAGVQRKYVVLPEYLNFGGKNVIAVRVYDEFQVGGIKRGRVRLVENIPDLEVEVGLAGIWKFKIGDDMEWKDAAYSDKEWADIAVPSIWQTQGYKDIHGLAWYRKTFKIDKYFEDERLIMLLGKIDDLDETYLNGRLLGRTGRIRKIPEESRVGGSEYSQLRAYYIPADYLNFDGQNIVAVRVYDGPGHGGIYDGPIGIVERHKYLRWKKHKKENVRSFFEFLFGN